jgi:hypothetical protein
MPPSIKTSQLLKGMLRNMVYDYRSFAARGREPHKFCSFFSFCGVGMKPVEPCPGGAITPTTRWGGVPWLAYRHTEQFAYSTTPPHLGGIC